MPFITFNNDPKSKLADYYNSVTNGRFASTANYPNVVSSPKPEIPSNIEQFSLSDDGFIRGGVQNAVLATTKDFLRITKFFTNPDGGQATGNTGYEKFVENAKGALFFTRQIGLQRSNPKLEINKGNVLSGLAGILGGPTRTFTGIGSLASVGGSAFGLHFDRIGVFGVVPANQKYGGDANSPTAGAAYSNNFKDKQSNLKITEKSNNRLLEYTAKIFNSNNNEVVLDSYLGGPNSLYGIIGRTRTISYYQTTFVKAADINDPKFNGFVPLTNKEIAEFETKNINSNSLQTVLAASPFYSRSITKDNIAKNNIENRIGVSTPSNVDSINMIKITNSQVFYDTNKGKRTSDVAATDLAPLDGKQVNGEFGKDLIKFRLEFLNNDVTGYKGSDNRIAVNTDVLTFRAYIDDFNDGMSAKWNSYRYMGRGEEFYVYDGFTRDINVSFTMFAHTRAELNPLYEKLNYLLSTFTPDYSEKLKMRGNIGYLTVGDYLYRQPGVFTDIKIGSLFEGPWNVGLNTSNNEEDENSNNELPMMAKIQLSFKPIQTFLPRKGRAGFIGRDFRAYPKKSQPNTQSSSTSTQSTTTTNTRNQTAASANPTSTTSNRPAVPGTTSNTVGVLATSANNTPNTSPSFNIFPQPQQNNIVIPFKDPNDPKSFRRIFDNVLRGSK